MRFSDALDAMTKKEEEGRARMRDVRKKADAIRYKGEEEASEIYSKTRNGLKKETAEYSSRLEKKLDTLEKKLKNELRQEKKKMKTNAGRKKKKADEAAYAFLVSRI